MPRRARISLISLFVAVIVGCAPLPPEIVTCEEETACPPSTGSSGASGSTTKADPESDTQGPDTDSTGSTGPDASASGTGTDGTTGAGSTDETASTTSNSSGTGEATTTGMMAFCGDGVVNQDTEECDDGSPSADGPCSPLCKRERIIFVLSIIVNGELSGLQGADAYCRSQASKALMADPSSPIKDPKNFKALLPSSTESIFERHFRGEGRYRLINGLTVSYSFDRLFSEPLQNAINVTEFGQTHVIPVWTASTADGHPYPGIDFCGDWTSVKGSASWGVSESTDAEWIEVSDEIVQQPTEHCAGERALYCVEQQ